MREKIPKAEFAVIGGSGTFSIEFPEDLKRGDLQVLQSGLTFKTPYGESPAFTLFKIKDSGVLTCKMHGWRRGGSRACASKQVFWILKEAGVKRILAEGGVGSINQLLNPRDIVIPNDFIDFSTRKDTSVVGEHLLIMRQPICPQIHRVLLDSSRKHHLERVFERGVYLVTEGYRFESRAEISMMRQWGADIVGQSLAPEVYLARDIGACYAGIYMVVNYAEGVVRDWDHDELKAIFYEESKKIGQIIIDALNELIDAKRVCGCMELRKETLLKER